MSLDDLTNNQLDTPASDEIGNQKEILSLKSEGLEDIKELASDASRKVDLEKLFEDDDDDEEGTDTELLKTEADVKNKITEPEVGKIRERIKSVLEDTAALVRKSIGHPEVEDKLNVDVRFQSNTDEQSTIPLSGIFAGSETTKTPSVASYKAFSAKDSFQLEREEEAVMIDREYYYEAYDLYKERQKNEISKNNYLQKKMIEFYKKKKMYHVLVKDSADVIELTRKYEHNLMELSFLRQRLDTEKVDIELELASLKDAHRKRKEKAQSLFEHFQKCQLELSNEIAEASTKPNLDKIVERCLKRQKLQFMNLVKMRFSWIKCKNMFAEKQRQLNALDNLGPDLRLVDYERLKFNNRNLQDKVEERETELTKIRLKCRNIMQILAHRREKTAAVEADIPQLVDIYENVVDEYEEVRMQLHELKQTRDDLRQKTAKMKAQAGLVGEPKLLRDMHSTIVEIDKLKKQVNRLKKEYGDVVDQLTKVTENMSSQEKLDNIRAEAGASQKLPEMAV